jgi:Na+/proline symporter
MTVLVAWLSLRLAGGFEGLVASLKAQDLERMLSVVDTRPGAQCNSWWAIAMFAFVMVSYNSVTASVKYFTCKDGREARRAAALAAVLMFVGAFLWFVPPIVARLHFAEALEALKAANPEIKNVAETSYALVAMKLLPAGMTGMIVVAMFAATMSSLSPSLNQTAAVFTQDVYKQLFRPWAKDREVFVFGQVISVVVGLLIIASALYFASFGSQKGLFHYMLKLGSIFGTPTVVPMFLALFLRRTPPWSALAAIIGAAPVSIYSLVYEVRYEWTVLGILAAGTVTFLLTTLFWASVPEASKRRIEGFYERMHRPVDFEAEVGRPNDPGQLKLVGYVSLAVGLFMMLILAVPNPLEGRIQIACVAGSIVVFATAMILTGYRKERLETARLAVPAIEPLSGADGEPPA